MKQVSLWWKGIVVKEVDTIFVRIRWESLRVQHHPHTLSMGKFVCAGLFHSGSLGQNPGHGTHRCAQLIPQKWWVGMISSPVVCCAIPVGTAAVVAILINYYSICCMKSSPQSPGLFNLFAKPPSSCSPTYVIHCPHLPSFPKVTLRCFFVHQRRFTYVLITHLRAARMTPTLRFIVCFH
jgi:hypothetical protein